MKLRKKKKKKENEAVFQETHSLEIKGGYWELCLYSTPPNAIRFQITNNPGTAASHTCSATFFPDDAGTLKKLWIALLRGCSDLKEGTQK